MPQAELDVLGAAEKSERDLMLRIAGQLPDIERLINHGP
jgi:hypothetical protein